MAKRNTTEIEFSLGQQIAELRGAVLEKIKGLTEEVHDLSVHQKEINGTVAEHQIMLGDYEAFKTETVTQAVEKSKAVAGRAAMIRSIFITILTAILIGIIAKLFNIPLH